MYWSFSYNFLGNHLSCTPCMPFQKMSCSKSHFEYTYFWVIKCFGVMVMFFKKIGAFIQCLKISIKYFIKLLQLYDCNNLYCCKVKFSLSLYYIYFSSLSGEHCSCITVLTCCKGKFSRMFPSYFLDHYQVRRSRKRGYECQECVYQVRIYIIITICGYKQKYKCDKYV